jgi:hypothetical protein
MWYFLEQLSFLKVYNSPFKPPRVKFYFGKVFYGVPYFYPRRWVKNKQKLGYSTAVPKIIGFDFVNLGWKTKWEETDYRFEWSPIWSFVFFKWQACILFEVEEPDSYWTSWLYYTRHTDKTKTTKQRIEICKKQFPQTYIRHSKDGKKRIDYYPLILK